MPLPILQPDLFGGETLVVTAASSSPYMNFRLWNNYRKADDKLVSCRICHWSFRRDGGSRRYSKCGLMGDSCCSATDINMGYTCDKWRMP